MSLFTEDFDEAQISELLKADELIKEAEENLDKSQLEKLHIVGGGEINNENNQSLESDIFFEKIKKKQNEEKTIFMNEKNSLVLRQAQIISIQGNFIKPTKQDQKFDTNFYDKEEEQEKNSLSEAGSNVQYRAATNTITINSTTNVEEEMVSLLKYEKLKKENANLKVLNNHLKMELAHYKARCEDFLREKEKESSFTRENDNFTRNSSLEEEEEEYEEEMVEEEYEKEKEEIGVDDEKFDQSQRSLSHTNSIESHTRDKEPSFIQNQNNAHHHQLHALPENLKRESFEMPHPPSFSSHSSRVDSQYSGRSIHRRGRSEASNSMTSQSITSMSSEKARFMKNRYQRRPIHELKLQDTNVRLRMKIEKKDELIHKLIEKDQRDTTKMQYDPRDSNSYYSPTHSKTPSQIDYESPLEKRDMALHDYEPTLPHAPNRLETRSLPREMVHNKFYTQQQQHETPPPMQMYSYDPTPRHRPKHQSLHSFFEEDPRKISTSEPKRVDRLESEIRRLNTKLNIVKDVAAATSRSHSSSHNSNNTPKSRNHKKSFFEKESHSGGTGGHNSRHHNTPNHHHHHTHHTHKSNSSSHKKHQHQHRSTKYNNYEKAARTTTRSRNTSLGRSQSMSTFPTKKYRMETYDENDATSTRSTQTLTPSEAERLGRIRSRYDKMKQRSRTDSRSSWKRY